MPESFGIKFRKVILPVHCRDCLLYQHAAAWHPTKNCKELGVLPSSDPCTKFTVNPLKFKNFEKLKMVLRILSRLDSYDLYLFSALCWRQAKKHVQESKFKIGQTVIIQLLNRSYVGNYAQGTVVGFRNKLILVSGKDGWIGMIQSKNLLDWDSWTKLRQRLISENKINDPRGILPPIGKLGLRLLTKPTIQNLQPVDSKVLIQPIVVRGKIT